MTNMSFLHINMCVALGSMDWFSLPAPVLVCVGIPQGFRALELSRSVGTWESCLEFVVSFRERKKLSCHANI